MGATATQVKEQAPAGSLEELRDRLSSAFRAQFPTRQADGTYRYHWVVATFPSYVIVSVDQPTGEEYFRYDYAIDGDTVTFSNPQALELQYVPKDAVSEAARIRSEHANQPRQQFRETRALSEAARSDDGSTISLTIIRAGFNVPRSRYYTESALRDGAGMFRGLKMYVDHQTRAEEQARPEGSLRDWAAVVTETAYDSTTKSLRATAKLIDPDFKAKVQALAEAGVLDTLGVSIRAVGAGEQDTIESVPTFRVDEFAAAISVDFVTEPGAGGRVHLVEAAAEEPGVDALTLPLLRERRPDLVRALLSESTQQHKEAGMGEITQEQLDAEKRRADEAERKAREAEEAKAVAESKLAATEEAAAKETAQKAIGAAIKESGLPEAGQNYLAESLKDSTDIEAAKAEIARFKSAVEAQAPRGSGVRGNGLPAGDGAQPSAESRPLEESFGRILGNPEAGKKAAAVGGNS